MKYRVTINLIGIFVLFAAQANAQRTDQARQISIIDDMAPVGLAYGQSLRINVFNPPARNDTPKFKMLVAPLILDAVGNAVAQADEIELDSGEFHSFDFKREAMPRAGEPGTGRVEVRARIRYRSFAIVDRTQLALPSLEIVSDSSGRTAGGALPVNIGIADLDFVPARGSAEAMLGIVPGQSLRATVFNPSQGTPIGGHIKVFDNRGFVIGQSAELVIPPGEFRSFDFDRSALGRSGEPGTDRLQLRTTLIFKSDDHGLGLRSLPASLEVIDNLTGRNEPTVPLVVIQTLHCSRGPNGEETCHIVSHPVPIS